MESGTRIGEAARRHHDRSFKAGLVEQSLQPGASVAVIARNNGINANLRSSGGAITSARRLPLQYRGHPRRRSCCPYTLNRCASSVRAQ